MFNPDARVATVRFGERRGDFRSLDQKGYPGICLPAPAELTRAFQASVLPAKWNRPIFYDGSMLHSGHIETPELTAR
jgi:Family of unknown function (DUF6445)